MSHKNPTRASLLEEIVTAGRRRVDPEHASQCDAFLKAYFAEVWQQDLESLSPEVLADLALRHWKWGRRRSRRRLDVRVYSTPDTRNQTGRVSVVETVAPDMPFLVSSLTMAVHAAGSSLHWFAHPMLDAGWRQANAQPGATRNIDSWIHMEVDALPDKTAERELRARVLQVLKQLDVVVRDWQPMRAALDGIRADLKQAPKQVNQTAAQEAADFLQWLDDNHFTFLGYSRQTLGEDEQGRTSLNRVAGSGLGLLRPSVSHQDAGHYVAPPGVINQYAQSTRPLVITKGSIRSPIHHFDYMDVVAVKRFDRQGRVTASHRFLGLFAEEGYAADPRSIPVLRQKINTVRRRADLRTGSHAAKALERILVSFPRDELFQSTSRELYTTAMGVLALHERQQLKLFIRRDRYGRFYSCLVYIPRERYNPHVRRLMAGELMRGLGGQDLEFELEFLRRGMARVHFTVRTPAGTRRRFNIQALEERLLEVSRGWQERLRQAFFSDRRIRNAARSSTRFAGIFPPAYMEKESPEEAVSDSLCLEALSREISLTLRLSSTQRDGSTLRLKLYSLDAPVVLSDILPTLERFGLRVLNERPYEVSGAHQERAWIQLLEVTHPLGSRCLDPSQKEGFEQALLRVRAGTAEDDALNALVLGGGMAWRKVALLRALCRYLAQTGLPYSFSYMASLLREQPAFAAALVECFETRFDPGKAARTRKRSETQINTRINGQLDQVSSLDADRVMRGLAGVIHACVRTNYYQTTDAGQAKAYLSFKLLSAEVPELPAPRPLFEIFVYSPDMEGVHLRAGRVARGGLRWSDRREDFRTEVLGLMKAQQVKNAVIVPVGAKGGFVVKRNPQGVSRQEQGKLCYQTFIRGLLDLTDNLDGDTALPPARVVCHDTDDPYMVVAADKGTASFSDIANQLAAEYRYWLGDAFASGGSHGYDHKRMGITARGAWESVQRHFAEMGHDVQKEPFTAVGIGDMGGDVFGNGMLLSHRIRLVAAFNHRHIFIDPDPDPKTGYQERRRLFRRSGSAWSDYNPDLISAGGGVFERSRKSIDLSPEIRDALGTEAHSLTPNELISRILCAPVDLLWNGGIGTYVKASTESHIEVGDHANDSLRVDAPHLRCKVIGEGGNLGMTQRGRIEYALSGGCVNTDFIDNAGGVTSSDLEVNIKIPLNEMLHRDLLHEKERDRLLQGMQRDVAEHVLEDCREQGQILSLLERVTKARLDEQSNLIRYLERQGLLDRGLEFLPSEDILSERSRESKGLTRPELSVLLAYSKMALHRALSQASLCDDPYFEKTLLAYFPEALAEQHRKALLDHRLRKELVATRLANSLVNTMGVAFPHRMAEDHGAKISSVTFAYAVASDLFRIPERWRDIEKRTGLAQNTRYELMEQIMALLKPAILWFLSRRGETGIAETLERYRPGVESLIAAMPRVLHGDYRSQWEARRDSLRAAGVPASLARQFAAFPMLASALDITELAHDAGRDPATVAALYFALGERLHIPWMIEGVQNLKASGRWDAIARAELKANMTHLHGVLAGRVLSSAGSNVGNPRRIIDDWLAAGDDFTRFSLGRLQEMQSAGLYDFPALSVAVAELGSLADHALSPSGR